ncbi:MAG: hypothetical protein CR217_03245 [Beijerinckiaceae bacterium]|nr:MAG: hypothetical protein CR217_03245 [Beijerinckiaceae bacterium]
MNASNLAEILTRPAFRIWFSGPRGSRRQLCRECGIIKGARLVRGREDEEIRRIAPRQLLTKDIQVDVGRGVADTWVCAMFDV